MLVHDPGHRPVEIVPPIAKHQRHHGHLCNTTKLNRYRIYASWSVLASRSGRDVDKEYSEVGSLDKGDDRDYAKRLCDE